MAYHQLTGRRQFVKGMALQFLYAHVREPAGPRPAGGPGERPGAVVPGRPGLDGALAACKGAAPWAEDEAASWWQRHGGRTA
ncbi:MAG TPA: hypothetical protein VD866_18365 [Urbifossiella sp.]|nr:hypothetical protein [Urbifossiella sp.]